MVNDLDKLEEKVGIQFTNKETLQQAMVHRSYINEHPDFKLPHNERLEFLGDAVLELVVTEYLYLNYENPEGDLTNWRASLVNSQMLAQIAEKYNLNEHLFLSKGEAKDNNPKARQYITANALEALIGAIYIDQGWDAAKKFVSENMLSRLDNILENELYLDPKSKFQEAAQEKFGITPSYKVISETGPDHNRNFVIGVYLDKKLVAKGQGTSKHEAQVAAADAGIKEKGW